MTKHLKKENFESHLNDTYRAALESDQSVELVLESVETHKTHSEEYECFSILFLGPQENFLEQRTYEVTHEKLGTFPLFLVPVGAVGQKIRYEALFNRKKVE